MVTVELALGLLVAAGVALVLGWVVSLVSLQTACADTASQVARQLARGDDQAAADAEGNAPAGAVVTTNTDVGNISVEVRLEASLGPIGPVPLRGAGGDRDGAERMTSPGARGPPARTEAVAPWRPSRS